MFGPPAQPRGSRAGRHAPPLRHPIHADGTEKVDGQKPQAETRDGGADTWPKTARTGPMLTLPSWYAIAVSDTVMNAIV